MCVVSPVATGLLFGWMLVAGCADPCGELESRLCERHEDTKLCELIQDPSRRALLSAEACESILKVVPSE